MKFLSDAFSILLSFKSYVMLPIIMLILSIAIGLKPKKAFKASVTLGIGFIGIFIIFDYFVNKIGPVLKFIVHRTGITQDVLDVGWPPLAGMAWAFKLAPILIILVIIINVIMLIFKLTNTINIDIWNYWHFIFTAQLVYQVSGNPLISIVAALVLAVLCIKLADWSVDDVIRISGVKGVSITTLSGLAYYPYTILMDKLFDKIPKFNKLEADPEHLKAKLGLLGEPMFIGLAMGAALGITAGYSVKDVLDLSLNIAAVIYILPKMSQILAEGLMPISEAMKKFMKKRFPSIKNTYIGLDLALLMGNPAVIVTGILLMPIALILALVLPGVRFIPLGDLPNMIGAVVMIVVATRGNVVRAFIASIPIIIGKLYAASVMANSFTNLAAQTGYKTSGYEGAITSFLDGGNLMRFWIVKLFTGSLWAIALVPFIGYSLYFVRNIKAKRFNQLQIIKVEKEKIG